ncbi:PEP-CTERM sorting domain-containing protein [Paludisphaera soli]|uniref:PEP-CTERM sorting domain-containing protein n=1 Tax=Paludisphaera soli TaxID=2712865 RepID=UPI0013EDE5CF|nr:PEP-CTERM sorting domain-containing protein [Paludisphaera soli]
MVQWLLRVSPFAFLLALASQAEAASVTYQLVNYAADQGGATVSGYFTMRPEPNDADFSVDDVLDWSVTISQGGVSYTTGMSDPGGLLTPVGDIRRTGDELTIAAGQGWMWIQSDGISLSYSRLGADEYSGLAGQIQWDAKPPSMGGTEPWVIARSLGATPVPEPSSLVLCASGMAIVGVLALRRRSS